MLAIVSALLVATSLRAEAPTHELGGLKIAAAICKNKRLAEFGKQRYASWDNGIGAKIEAGKGGFKEIAAYILKKGEADANANGARIFTKT